MLRLAKHVVVVVLFILLAGCAGGGCSSGCSCGGVTPLAEGFDPGKRMENVAAVRLTDSGIDFLEQNIGPLAGQLIGDPNGGGALTFEVPPTSGSFNAFITTIDYDACKNGPNPNATPPECVAEIDLAGSQLQITPSAPHNLVISGPLNIRLQKLPLEITYFCIPLLGCVDSTINVVLNGNDSCPGENQTYAPVGLDTNVSIEIDPDQTHARYGYSRVRVSVGVNEDNLKDSLHFCGGFDATILEGLKDLVGGLLIGPLVDTLNSSVEDALCQQANPDLSPTCPVGTVDVNGVCRYGADPSSECASIILGTDGNIDLGGLLQSISPGTKGAFDFLFAVGGHSVRDDGSGHHWGDLNPIGGGATMGMYGGWEPTPVSGCVTPVDLPRPSDIPIPDELTANTVSGWPASLDGPHFGLALSERFANYALTQAYNSGALCLGITASALGDAVPLSTSLIGIGLGAQSLNELGRQKAPAEIAIILRPGAPPGVEFGNGTDIATDPLIHLTLPDVAFDFYVWSLDRYVRAFTATMDIDVPMNLMVSPDGLVPVVEDLGVQNAVVTNSQLIREDPTAIAEALQGLLGDLVGGFLGDAFPPIDLNGQLSSLGLALEIPESTADGSPGLRLLTKGSDDFLGIFATLAVAAPPNATPPPISITGAELSDLEIDPAGLRLETIAPGNQPRATIRLGSNLDDGTYAIEWQYKLNHGPWHPFTQRRYLVVDDPSLRTQGRHTVYVRSRVVGQAMTLDPEPVEVTVLIDDEQPVIRLVQDQEGFIHVKASDGVTPSHALDVRVRFSQDGEESDEASWSAWMKADQIAPLLPGEDVDFIEVEARDEDGHIGTVRQPIIRGRADAAGTGCGCRIEGRSDERPSSWLFALGLAFAAAWRRRESSGTPSRGPRKVEARRALAVLGVVLFGGLWSGCSCSDESAAATPAPGCRGRGDCQVIRPGLIGAYTSGAAASDGTVWVAGYLEANWEDDLSFGDLVVGRLEGETVAWKVVDGLPVDAEVDIETYDPKGFRGGMIDAGDDVGLWTSVAIDGAGMPAVAYYDASHSALRYASYSGDSWSITTVQQIDDADIGRYAKLRFVGGKPVIAYMFLEPAAGNAVRSGVRLATGSATDAASAQWSFEEAAVDEDTPCTADLCGLGTACVLETRTCADRMTDCAADCGGDECVSIGGTSQCAPVAGSGGTKSYPDALGLYVSADLKPDGSLGLAFYDRIHGNVVMASNSGGQWVSTILDGESGGQDTGDKGIGTSLDIDAQGHWHVAYVDGLNEGLNYLMVQDGTTPGAPEVVDDGLGSGDGQHLVGDDSNVYVTPGGEVHISYQDATAGQLRYAVGTPSGEAHSWNNGPVTQDGFAGAFSVQLEVEGAHRVLNWWRLASPAAHADVRVVSAPAL